MRHAYELIGYGLSSDFDPIVIRRRTQALRDKLMSRIATLFPHEVSVIRRASRWRTRLQIGNRRHVAVLISRTVRPWKETIRWQVDPIAHESRLVTPFITQPDREPFSAVHLGSSAFIL